MKEKGDSNMKKKLLLAVFCTVTALSMSACQPKKAPETETTEEVTTEEVTTEETSTEEAATEETTTEETTTEAAEKETQRETQAQTQPQTQAQTQAQPQTLPQTEAPAAEQGDGFELEPSPAVYEEEYLQCPYCAEWFSAQPDGGLWNPYDRHMLEEREQNPGGQETEQEMAQCPDCLNWYETGNIFRNHICSGR